MQRFNSIKFKIEEEVDTKDFQAIIDGRPYKTIRNIKKVKGIKGELADMTWMATDIILFLPSPPPG